MKVKTEGGYIRNCNLFLRLDNEPPKFVISDDHKVIAFLDGYTIMPNEKYEELARMAGISAVGLEFIEANRDVERPEGMQVFNVNVYRQEYVTNPEYKPWK